MRNWHRKGKELAQSQSPDANQGLCSQCACIPPPHPFSINHCYSPALNHQSPSAHFFTPVSAWCWLKHGPWQEDSWQMSAALGPSWPPKLGLGLVSGVPQMCSLPRGNLEAVAATFFSLFCPSLNVSTRSQGTWVWQLLPSL